MRDSERWRPSASFAALHARAALLRDVRAFFAERGVLEVETPVLCRAPVTDVHIESLSTVVGDERLYLQTSPEYAMKRLLAAGSGPIFQICKSFRDDERSALHEPEFTMLEWYRPGFDYHALMAEVDALLCALLGCRRATKHSYREAFLRAVGIDPLTAGQQELAAASVSRGLARDTAQQLGREGLMDFLLTHNVLPALGDGLHCLYDFPVEQAALAKIRREDPPIAERFEFYYGGVELANGYAELGNAAELKQRMRADIAKRAEAGMATVTCDEHLLSALRAGLPECSGVALGLDRVAMLAGKHRGIQEVIAFAFERA